MNIVANALSHIHEANMLRLIEFKYVWYENLQGNYFRKFWIRAESRTNAMNNSSSKGTFHTTYGILYLNGIVCVPNLAQVKQEILFECQSASLKGQPRIHHTLVLFSTQICWPKMHHDVDDYVLKYHQ